MGYFFCIFPKLVAMKTRIVLLCGLVAAQAFTTASAQTKDPVIERIIKEETDNSQLQQLAHELFDGIGPRLVGTPQMQKAGDWAVAKYKSWGIDARIEKWGDWRGWERGITHIDMV